MGSILQRAWILVKTHALLTATLVFGPAGFFALYSTTEGKKFVDWAATGIAWQFEGMKPVGATLVILGAWWVTAKIIRLLDALVWRARYVRWQGMEWWVEFGPRQQGDLRFYKLSGPYCPCPSGSELVASSTRGHWACPVCQQSFEARPGWKGRDDVREAVLQEIRRDRRPWRRDWKGFTPEVSERYTPRTPPKKSPL
jgi:hypothetical protein